MRRMTIAWAASAAVLFAIGGCIQESEPTAADVPDAAASSAATNRIDIPAAVRQNLGLTFMPVEARRVEQTLRAPGRFEYLPTAKREYRTMLPGRIELRVNQYEHVDVGTVLYEIESPSWREVQLKLTDADASIERHTARLNSFGPLLAAHEIHEERLDRSIQIRKERVAQLEGVSDAGGGRIADLNMARGAVATAESQYAELGEKHAQLAADEAETRAQLAAAIAKREYLLDSTAAILRCTVDQLHEEVESSRGRQPRWRALSSITVRAESAGIVESLGVTNGAWATEETTVLTVVQPDRLRFRAIGLQSDMGRLRDGLPARIVPPTPTRAAGSIDLADTMTGTLALGLSGDADDRTIDLVVVPETLAAWARAGVSAQLEIVTDATATAVQAIPRAAVQRDGLVPVIFRRDPMDANKAIRIEADLGLDDGRWIEVRSGLRLGDEVVLDGAFQLVLATATGGGRDQGGHFHADGTFHAGEDE